jgi:hypothetical protein
MLEDAVTYETNGSGALRRRLKIKGLVPQTSATR